MLEGWEVRFHVLYMDTTLYSHTNVCRMIVWATLKGEETLHLHLLPELPMFLPI